MASSILSSLTSKVSFAATNELTGAACWTNLKIIEVDITAPSENSDTPLSTDQYSDSGTTSELTPADIQSAKVIAPTKVKISAICPDLSTLEGVLSVFANNQATVSVLTKGYLVQNMSVLTVEVDQTPDVLSAAKITIELERTLPQQPTTGYAPGQPSDLSSIGVRLQTLASGLTTTVGNLYTTVSNAASSAISAI